MLQGYVFEPQEYMHHLPKIVGYHILTPDMEQSLSLHRRHGYEGLGGG